MATGKAILKGYYGKQNVGDDAFLAVSAWGARKYYGSKVILGTAHTISNTYGILVRPMYFQFRGSRLLNRAREYWLARGAKWIFGGGSNFHTASRMEHCSRVVKMAGPGKHSAVGVSIGPFRDSGAEAACAKLLNQLTFVGVRDRKSYERACSIASNTQIELTFDLAPLLPHVAGFDDFSPRWPRRGLGVALCNYERFVGGDLKREAKRVEIVAEAIRKCAVAGLMEEVTLVDFNGHAIKGDHRVHNDLARRIGDCVRVSHLPYINDPLAVMRAVANLRAIIAMRLHAAVFGFCTSTPVLMLAYHEKCWGWADMVGFPSSLLMSAAQTEASELAQGIKRLLSPETPLPTLRPAEAANQALKNWSWLKI